MRRVGGLLLSLLLFACAPRGAKVKCAGASASGTASEIVTSLLQQIGQKLNRPDLIILFSPPRADLSEVSRDLSVKSGAQIWGFTSNIGVLSNKGYLKKSISVVAFQGVNAHVVYVPLDDPMAAGENAARNLLEAFGGKKPDIVLMSVAPPGSEEKVLKGIMNILPANLPIYGGTAADNDLTGKWGVVDSDGFHSSGVVLAGIETSGKIGFALHSGYPRTGKQGKVTQADGRLLKEIDGRPAAIVYNEWTGGAFNKEIKEVVESKQKEKEMVLVKSDLWPLARIIAFPGGEFTLTVHPFEIYQDGSISVFAEVNNGDTLELLHGTQDDLVNRISATCALAMSSSGLSSSDIAGAVVFYCAGSKMAIEGRAGELSQKLNTLLQDVPYVGAFTFGEQGYIKGIGNLHGNLLCSVVLFGK